MRTTSRSQPPWASLLLALFLVAFPALMSGTSGTGAGDRGRALPANADSEPNDQFADATEVNVNVTIVGTISGPEVGGKIRDIYKVHLNQSAGKGDRVQAHFVGTDLLGAGISGVRTFLHDPDLFVLDSDVWDALDQNLTTSAARTGWYSIVLEGAPGPATNESYNLTVTIDRNLPLTTDGNVDPASATAIADGSSVSGTVTGAGDRQDFYTISLTANATAADLLQIAFTAAPAAGIRADFYGSTFAYVGTDATALSPVTTGFGVNRTRLSLAPPSSGTYYVRVVAMEAGGPYGFSVNVQSVSTDANNNCTTAEPLIFADRHNSTRVNGSVGEGIDPADLFTFAVQTEDVVTVGLSSLDYDAASGLPEILVDLWNRTCDPAGAYGTGDPPRPEGGVTGTVDENATGNVTHHVVVRSGGANAGGGRYSFTLVRNTPPLIRPEVPAKLAWGDSQSIEFLPGINGTFTERDGDAMNITWTAEGDIAAGLVWNVPGVKAAGSNAVFEVINDSAGNGTIRITPAPFWKGSGYLRLVATDSLDLSRTLLLPLRVFAGNHRPAILFPYNETHRLGDSGEFIMKVDTVAADAFNLSNYFVDPDAGDTLRYVIEGSAVAQEWEVYDLGTSELRILKAINVAGVRIAFGIAPNGIDHTGIISIIPQAGWRGNVSVFALAWDDGVPPMANAGNLSLNIWAIGTQEPPRWSKLPEVRIVEDEEVEIDLDTYARDLDKTPFDPPLKYVAVSANASHLRPIVGSDGLLSLRPARNWTGRIDVTLNVTDAQGLSAETTLQVNVTPVPDGPAIIGSIPDGDSVTVPEGGQLLFVLNVTDSDTPLPQLTYAWSLDGIGRPAARFGSFAYRSDYNASGNHTVSVVVNDSDSAAGARRSWAVVVTDVNRLPPPSRILAPRNDEILPWDAPLVLSAQTVIDPDGDPVTYRWTLDGKVIGTNSSLSLEPMKPGRYTVVLEVSDGKHPAALYRADFQYTVKQAEEPGGTPAMVTAGIGVAILVAIVVGVILRRYYRGEDVPKPPPPPPAGAGEDEREDEEEEEEEEEEEGAEKTGPDAGDEDDKDELGWDEPEEQ